jgi:predicted PurR-regulated permease PerM
MITEQIILSLYAVLLLEVGLLLLIIILIVLDIKNTVDSVKNLVNKFVKLGHITVDTAEEFKSKLTSLSGLTSIIGGIPTIISLLQKWNNKSTEQNTEQKEEEDDLNEALSNVTPKKKRRII